MNENEEIKRGLNADTTTAIENETQEKENELPKEAPVLEKKFTQEDVNRFIADRLEKSQARLFKKYGISNGEELDLMVGKSQQYDEMKSRYDDLINQNNALNERLLFVDNNIDLNQIQDLKYYFKGKGIALNDENLKAELSTHPYWVSKVDVKPVGVEHKDTKKSETDDEYIKRVFRI